MLQRYYLVVTLLLGSGSESMTREELSEAARKVAERLALVYQLHSPDSFDREVIGRFLDTLEAEGAIRPGADGRLAYDPRLPAVDEAARLILGAQIRQTLLQVAHAENRPL
jgi:glycerol-3-phosphate O-acyltransferase